ncbi:type III pantothenate kinase [Sulfuriferula sp. AH1]|uniref:type III pantothenate kinase n=1 Tax=Sulfuriferula sp. AH1 TaxID=1985873 RepID=UPI00210080AA|nr:type III pantothenate kinase [Sulfuriferula sp. AH1]
MKLLAIDAGNTRIKWGLHDGRQWLQRGHLAHNEIARLSTLAVPDRIIVSNVAGAAVAAAIAQAFPAGLMHTIRSTTRQCGVSNHYKHPAQLGSDRWAALIGAHQLGARTALVVTAGTALTVDALHAGEFLGGLIAPAISSCALRSRNTRHNWMQITANSTLSRPTLPMRSAAAASWR